jgi:hypothetical protein
MVTQTQTTPPSLYEFVFALPIAEPIQADPRDYGFDFDEEEIGHEMLAPLPVNLSVQALPEVAADEFETTFHYFLS